MVKNENNHSKSNLKQKKTRRKHWKKISKREFQKLEGKKINDNFGKHQRSMRTKESYKPWFSFQLQ